MRTNISHPSFEIWSASKEPLCALVTVQSLDKEQRLSFSSSLEEQWKRILQSMLLFTVGAAARSVKHKQLAGITRNDMDLRFYSYILCNPLCFLILVWIFVLLCLLLVSSHFSSRMRDSAPVLPGSRTEAERNVEHRWGATKCGKWYRNLSACIYDSAFHTAPGGYSLLKDLR